jgi:hypothetical protein
MKTTNTYYVFWGDLYHYATGTRIRAATRREERASRDAARHDGGAGVIDARDLSRPVARATLARLANEGGAS